MRVYSREGQGETKILAIETKSKTKLKEKQEIGVITMLTLEMIQEAKKTLEGVARVTPMYESAFINPNANVFIKCENMQLTGSFKLRGAYVKTNSLTD